MLKQWKLIYRSIPLLVQSSYATTRFRRNYASVAASSNYRNLSVNSTIISNFLLKNVTKVEEFDIEVLHLEHQKTGTPYYHVYKKDDYNNVFCVAFRTPPSNSTGLPHILEHVTLCGSHKYPVKDPFFKMMNRSLSTYMNALTGSDLTMYPFSTENEADFKNLMDVYLDSVFRPRLDELSFKQDGWRLEHEDPRNPATKIIFKGVVFNEMKGALSDPTNLFLTRLQQQLYSSPSTHSTKPPSTYSFVSGGDPLYIPDLTWHDLKAFHAACYHPSNSCFITYGNFDMMSHAELIDQHIVGFGKRNTIESPHVYLWDAPKRVVEYGPSDPMLHPGRQTKVSVSFLANKSTEVYESIVLQVLASLLMDGASSPMYKELIDSQLGSDYSPSSGYDRTATRTYLSFGLQGLKPEHVDQVEMRIMEVFDRVKKEGFDKERIETIIHQIQLSLKHRQANFGMMTSQSMSSHWAHGGDPVEALEVNKHITKLNSEIYDRIPSLIDQYFLNNKHRLTFIMNSDEEYYNKLAFKEAQLLDSKTSKLTDLERKKVFEDGLALTKSQEANDDLSVLPTLTVQQVAATNLKSYHVMDVALGNYKTSQIRETSTNGVSYITLCKSLSDLDCDLLPYVPLYSTVLTSLGTLKSPLPELSERIRQKTGGISTFSLASSSPFDLNQTRSGLYISTSSLKKNIFDMYDLVKEVLTKPDWTQKERLKVALKSMANDFASSVAESGHALAMSVASSSITKACTISEKFDGLSQVALLNQLVDKFDYEVLIAKLKSIHEYVMNHGMVRLALVCEKDNRSQNELAMGTLLDDLSCKTTTEPDFRYTNHIDPIISNKRQYVFPFPVNYVARSFKAVPYAHKDSSALAIYSQLATHHFLHQTIREKGGAYGGGARHAPLNGTLSLFSYRDPNPEKTLNAFNELEEWNKNIIITDQELHEAKLGVLQNLYAPISASEEGMSRFKYDLHDSLRFERRELILSTTLKDVRRVAEKYVIDKPHCDVIIGSAQSTLEGFKTVPLM